MNIKRTVSAMSATAMAVAMATTAVPAFAEEIQMQEQAALMEEFVASFEDAEVQQVAQYLVDNGISLAEAENMVALYQMGMEEESQVASVASVNSLPQFYNSTIIVPNNSCTPHYGIFIADDPSAPVEISATLDMPTTIFGTFTNSDITLLNGYNDIRVEKGRMNRLNIDRWMREDFPIGTTPKAMFKFKFGWSSYASESALRNVFSFNVAWADALSDNGVTTFQFHTYALGDVNHDGRINATDYTQIMNFVVMSTDFCDVEYANVSSQIAGVVRRAAADINMDGYVDLSDAVMFANTIAPVYDISIS